jgi:hypothetical protein
VLEVFGLVVDFGPVEAEDFDEEELEEAVAAEDVEGELFAGLGEADTGAGLVVDEVGLGEGLDHGGEGSGGDGHGGGELAHRDEIVIDRLLFEVDLLEVIFDGAAGHWGLSY